MRCRIHKQKPFLRKADVFGAAVGGAGAVLGLHQRCQLSIMLLLHNAEPLQPPLTFHGAPKAEVILYAVH